MVIDWIERFKRPDGTIDRSKVRRHVSRQADKANKRLRRLEKNDLTSSPAYQKFLEEGGQKFSVKGKDWNEIQRELSRINKFLDSKTSTIRGLNNTLKEMAANIGMKYSSLRELQSKSNKFFELASKVEQYLRKMDDIASAIGYQKIWEAINEYTEREEVNLAETEKSIEDMTEDVSDLVKGLQKGEHRKSGIADFNGEFWYLLD